MYGLAHRLLIQGQENLRLQRELGYLNLATVRFEQLQDKMEEVRKARHDLRHHLTAVSYTHLPARRFVEDGHVGRRG